MQIKEFKAWLDGFSEAMGDAPTPEQWVKIKAKLETVHPLEWGKLLGVGPMQGPNLPNFNPYRSPTAIDPQWAAPRVTAAN